MKFCMITTFFGTHSFGGDAAYVERLSQALCRRGHEVHVFHCVDAFNAVKGNHPLRSYTPPPGIHIHELKSNFGILSPISTQMTGRPYFKAEAIAREVESEGCDVVHFHNISLVGGPGLLEMGRGAVRLMTAHEHWLICPMHLLWKYDDRACDTPTCVRCSLAGHRPPQLWRYTGAIARGLSHLDALLFPSKHTLNQHQDRGIQGPMHHLPYFLPDDWATNGPDGPTLGGRPYIAAAGRLVKMKGFQRLIGVMKYLPEVDLRLAGTGPYAEELRRLADGLPNVRFEGLLSGRDLSRLFSGARAVVVPSLFPETFGYVVLEAFAVRTPVIVARTGGALVETGVESGGGVGYDSDSDLLVAIRRMTHDGTFRDLLAESGYRKRVTDWSESHHIDAYLKLIESVRRTRQPRPPHFARTSATEGVEEEHAKSWR